MAEFPALPLFTDAYLRDCWHLSDAEHGRYFLVMMLIWQTPECRIPNDREWISRKLRRSPEQYDLEIKPIIDEFCHTSGNWVTQKRLTRERDYLRKNSKLQSDRAKYRWNKDKVSCRSDATLHASGNAPTPTPTPTPSNKKNNINVIQKKPEEDLEKIKRGSRVPDNFEPDETCHQLAAKYLMSDEDSHMAYEKFMDYFNSAPGAKGVKLDWNATFRNWIRNDYERKTKSNGKVQR